MLDTKAHPENKEVSDTTEELFAMDKVSIGLEMEAQAVMAVGRRTDSCSLEQCPNAAWVSEATGNAD